MTPPVTGPPNGRPNDSPPAPRRYTISDTLTWEQVEGKQIFGGDVLDQSSGSSLSAMYWQLGTGERSEIPVPVDEVWIVSRGAVSIRSGSEVVRAGVGELLVVPRGLPGEAEAHADTQLLTVASPPSWEVDEAAWAAAAEGGPTTGELQHIVPEDLDGWEPVGGRGSSVLLADLGRITGTDLGLRFARLARPGRVDLTEVAGTDGRLAVPTRGAVIVRGPGFALAVAAGELVHLPAGQAGALEIPHDSDTDEVAVVFVTAARSAS